MSMCQKLAASILFLFCGISAIFGQGSYTAQIRGTVKDQSGAVVQGATVTITNDATGISVVARSNQEGLYILTGLRPATGGEPGHHRRPLHEPAERHRDGHCHRQRAPT